ncbi:MAG: hypothetical protein WCP39_08345 [Chlamydiota bacterium]
MSIAIGGSTLLGGGVGGSIGFLTGGIPGAISGAQLGGAAGARIGAFIFGAKIIDKAVQQTLKKVLRIADVALAASLASLAFMGGSFYTKEFCVIDPASFFCKADSYINLGLKFMGVVTVPYLIWFSLKQLTIEESELDSKSSKAVKKEFPECFGIQSVCHKPIVSSTSTSFFLKTKSSSE